MNISEVIEALVIGGVAVAPLTVQITQMLKWALSRAGILKDGYSAWVAAAVSFAIVFVAIAADVVGAGPMVGARVERAYAILTSFSGLLVAVFGYEEMKDILPPIKPSWEKED